MHHNHHILKLSLTEHHQNIATNAFEFHVSVMHHVLQPQEQVVVHENQTFLYKIEPITSLKHIFYKHKLAILKLVQNFIICRPFIYIETNQKSSKIVVYY